ncbi:DUF423 domain-containing protein [Wohlfahrtiimonas chitiniclastica]|uniref:DUF423 domain-containing protein n=1 Tax=Wohlfahrtiimonas chitiniclastica TaxID=400946 RepID=UPI001BCC21FC|nr:DUF423 domain-containing protein [Wohlfahrtiimonas chitiniclastica]MBS7815467.1 DUF423 domain-containing protein [Wohlfahrtiimonas chitiniclastica]
MRSFFIIGGLMCAVAVAFGAFGAHALKPMFNEYQMSLWERGNYYQMIHGIAILLSALAAYLFQTQRYFFIASALFTLGIVCFAGSLYAIALTGITAFGMVAPIGGISLMIAWLLFLIGCFKFSSNIVIPKGA